jgi:hypothetical protein
LSGKQVAKRLLIGVDPGKTSGLAVLDGDDFWSVDLDDPLDVCDEVHRMLRWKRPTVVAVERYTFTRAAGRMTRQYDALEVIGALRYICHTSGVSFVLRGASESARVGSPAVLRALGWWARGFDHRNRAAAQLALLLQQTYPEEFVRRAHLAV